MKIGIIGGGWNGCHLALVLTKKGHDVTILERNDDIFQAVSGSFGIRLHKGPHYPRSDKTRERCRETHHRFCRTYPELVVHHEYAVYALGNIDSMGNPPKVSKDEFTAVCFEDPSCKLLDLDSSEYTNLLMAADMEEPSIAVGSRLRETFRQYLKDANIPIVCNFEVTGLVATETTNMIVKGLKNRKKVTKEYEKVINCSGYNNALLNSRVKTDFPFPMETKYQPCIALVYTDTQPTSEKPFSFIVMDGWFPCIMPYIEDEVHVFQGTSASAPAAMPATRKYILTHGAHTIMASCSYPDEAYTVLNELTDEFIEQHIKPRCEHEINRFWPTFAKRFKYHSWKGEVLCKIRTQKEFRGSVTYAGPYGVIHVIPGKISNIFDAEEETVALLDSRNRDRILVRNGYSYVKGGVLDHACNEISELPTADDKQNTGNLNTYRDVKAAAEAQAQAQQSAVSGTVASPVTPASDTGFVSADGDEDDDIPERVRELSIAEV